VVPHQDPKDIVPLQEQSQIAAFHFVNILVGFDESVTFQISEGRSSVFKLKPNGQTIPVPKGNPHNSNYEVIWHNKVGRIWQKPVKAAKVVLFG
jgi:hypothetical protein